jgi:hypothetical protein
MIIESMAAKAAKGRRQLAIAKVDPDPMQKWSRSDLVDRYRWLLEVVHDGQVARKMRGLIIREARRRGLRLPAAPRARKVWGPTVNVEVVRGS